MLNIKEWKKIYHANVILKKTRVAIVMSDKIDFIAKIVLETKIMIKMTNPSGRLYSKYGCTKQDNFKLY